MRSEVLKRILAETPKEVTDSVRAYGDRVVKRFNEIKARKMSTRKKLLFLWSLISIMIFYVGWVFYISEPSFIDNSMDYKNLSLKKYDYITIPEKGAWGYDDNEVMTGMVLQVDDNHALIKVDNARYSWQEDGFLDLTINKSHFRIVGQGTFYHKVNQYIGFNIMLITQVVIGILLLVLAYTTISTTWRVLNEYEI